jgi:hypothetical protein
MPPRLADERMSQTKGLASQSEAPGSEINKLAAAILSGETGGRIARLDNQFGKSTAFTLARGAQSGLLLTESILGMHKGPENGLLIRLCVGTDDAGWGGRGRRLLCFKRRQTSMVMGSSMNPLNADRS